MRVADQELHTLGNDDEGNDAGALESSRSGIAHSESTNRIVDSLCSRLRVAARLVEQWF